MEKATSTIRRSGAIFMSLGTLNQDLSLIISDLKSLKSQVKVIRDSQETIFKDIINWTSVEENRPLQELFLHLSDLNALWSQCQTEFAEQISEFKHQFETIFEGEKHLDALRNKFAECEVTEQKALKKLKKVQKKKAEDVVNAQTKVNECQAQKQLAQTEVSEKVKENEAVKLILLKNGLLKLSKAYLGLSQKCIYIFEAQREIVKGLPDIEDKEIHNIRFDGLSNAKSIIHRAEMLVKNYSVAEQPPQQSSIDSPPPYTLNPEFFNAPYNPYYDRSAIPPENGNPDNNGLYPHLVN